MTRSSRDERLKLAELLCAARGWAAQGSRLRWSTAASLRLWDAVQDLKDAPDPLGVLHREGSPAPELWLGCSFCGKPRRDVLAMVEAETGAVICNECVSVAVDKLVRPIHKYKRPAEPLPLSDALPARVQIDTAGKPIEVANALRELALAIDANHLQRELDRMGAVRIRGPESMTGTADGHDEGFALIARREPDDGSVWRIGYIRTGNSTERNRLIAEACATAINKLREEIP